jgi:hypothetical protein
VFRINCELRSGLVSVLHFDDSFDECSGAMGAINSQENGTCFIGCCPPSNALELSSLGMA